MWGHLWAILALVVLCALWVLFQSLLKRMDPGCPTIEDRCGGCGNCARHCPGKD